MPFDPEPIYAALFALISGNPAFTTTSRRFIQFQNCEAGIQPALYQRTGNLQSSESDDFGEPTYRYHAWWFIYCQISPSPDSLPSAVLNPLLSAAINALLPAPGLKQTLHNTLGVVHAWVDGEIMVYEGLLPDDTQAWAVIPITILGGA